MNVIPTELPDVLLIEPVVHGDERGFFLQTYNVPRYAAHGIETEFVQDNLSSSAKGTVRGLHFQNPHAQAKLVWAVEGEIFDVAVDVRAGSATFGKWVGHTLSAQNHRQLFIPPGFAHGFCVTSESALVAYKCSAVYHRDSEIAVLWDDPEIGIAWPIAGETAIVSEKDRGAALLSEVEADRLRFAANRS